MKSDHINELAAALAKAQSEMGFALKDSKNPFYKSNYADLKSVWMASQEALNKNGLSVAQVFDDNKLVTILLHTSGQWIQGSCPLLNPKGDMQGLGAASTYARRYGLAAIVGVIAEDDDGDGCKAPEQKPQKESTFDGKVGPKHTITFGKFRGKKISEISVDDLRQYVEWMRAQAANQKKDFGGEPKAIADWLESVL
jgi:hypothetical protein